MKNNFKIILNILIFLSAQKVGYAQGGPDIHLTQYNASPLNLNPALAGLNTCRFRLNANTKFQYANSSNFPFVYKTANVSFDMSISRGYKYKNFFGFGLNYFTDVSGDINFATHKLELALAYHIQLNKYATSTLSFAIIGGGGYRSIDWNKSTYDDQYIDNQYNQNGPKEVLDRNNFFYGDVGIGSVWNMTRKVSRKNNDYNFYNNYYLGLYASHLNQPKLVFFKDNPERQYAKVTFHGGAAILIKGKFAMLPSFMFLHQGTANELNIGTYARYHLGYLPSSKIAILLGVFVRVNNQFDAVAPAIRFDYKKLQVGFSYDINTSKFSKGSGTVGGPELSIIYGGCFGNNNKVKFCPQL
ncbi:MAG: PorP/SprF family type IX secretion system membrane protein [Bacteroidota bacterium]